jgi:hypothetical protein
LSGSHNQAPGFAGGIDLTQQKMAGSSASVSNEQQAETEFSQCIDPDKR